MAYSLRHRPRNVSIVSRSTAGHLHLLIIVLHNIDTSGHLLVVLHNIATCRTHGKQGGMSRYLSLILFFSVILTLHCPNFAVDFTGDTGKNSLTQAKFTTVPVQNLEDSRIYLANNDYGETVVTHTSGEVMKTTPSNI